MKIAIKILFFLVVNYNLCYGQGLQVDSITNATNFSGCIVFNSHKLNYQKCFGNACDEPRVKNSLNTIFEIGSTSKQFTVVAILKLLQEKGLATSADLSTFFQNVPNDKKKITIHQLMTHSSGLNTYHDKKSPLENLDKAKALKRIFRQKLQFSPGERYSYSNSAYTFLALIVEKLSGEDFKSYMPKMLKGNGLAETGFYGERFWERGKVACGYSFRKDGHPYDRGLVRWGGLGAGYMMTSVKDYSKWLSLIVNGDINYPRMFAKHIRYTDVKDEAYYGYGWVIADKDGIGEYYYHHGGDISLGYITTIRIYPKQEAYLIITSNTFNHQGHELFDLKNAIENWLASNP